MSSDEHWLSRLRDFVNKAVKETKGHQTSLDGHRITLEEFEPLETIPQSVWVDGGSGYIDLVGGSVYVVRAAAGLFTPEEEIVWEQDMRVGFTTLARNVDRLVGIQRDILEIETAIKLLHKGAEFAVLDNSLASYASMHVPYSILRYFTTDQADESPEYEYFHAYIKFKRRFDLLIKECLKQDVKLAGAAKDPKSRSFGRQLRLPPRFNDSTTIGLLAGDKVGFTKPLQTKYLEVERVKQFLEAMSVLIDGRGNFCSSFGILKSRARVFRLDYLDGQKENEELLKRFITSMHDGNGYLMPSHVVHKKATVTKKLMDSLSTLILTRIAKQDMAAATHVFGTQRRSRFG
jgi:hypothetical protein